MEDFPDNNPEPEIDDDSVIIEPEEAEIEGDFEGGEHLQLCVGMGIRQRRLDKYLNGRFGQFSRTTIQRLIKEQGVTVNGKPAKASQKLNPKDLVDLIVPPRPVRELVPEDIPLDVIYEDESIIVINKQANIICHPARGNTHGTLVNALVFHANKIATVGEDFRPGIVHRLDRNTTGVMVVAKDEVAHWRISKQFHDRTTRKSYLAITHGCPELDGDCINQPLGVHPGRREKYAIRHDIGKEAITFYEVLERFKGFALVHVKPRTGRTHQIRIHLAHIKNPIVADDMYGGKLVYPWQMENREPAVEEPIISRCALHAWQLEITHPETNERMKFEAPLPPDMQLMLEELRTYRCLKKAK